MFRVVREGLRNLTFVGFHRQRAGLELIGVVVRWRMRPVLRIQGRHERLFCLGVVVALGDGGAVCQSLVFLSIAALAAALNCRLASAAAWPLTEPATRFAALSHMLMNGFFFIQGLLISILVDGDSIGPIVRTLWRQVIRGCSPPPHGNVGGGVDRFDKTALDRVVAQRAPCDQCQQRHLERQTQYQGPVGDVEELRVLQHVDVLLVERAFGDPRAKGAACRRPPAAPPARWPRLWPSRSNPW